MRRDSGKGASVGLLGGQWAGWYRVDLGEDRGHVFHVRVAHIDGRPRAIGLAILPRDDAHPKRQIIDGELLRGIPVSQLVAVATEMERAQFWKALGAAARPPRPGPGGYGPEHWQEVARVWQEARAKGTSTRRAVAEYGHVAMSTADLWIRRAKNVGAIREDG